jgi:hypothetical protein
MRRPILNNSDAVAMGLPPIRDAARRSSVRRLWTLTQSIQQHGRDGADLRCPIEPGFYAFRGRT